MEIETDEKFLEWLDTIEASKSTRSSYLSYMKIFCKCVNKTPTELINESIKEVKEGKLPAERKTKGYVAKFKKCLKDKGLAPKSQQAAMASLKSFFKSYDMPLSQSIARSKKAQILEENNGFLKREDIIKLIANAKNLRERSIILCMASSGMAIREIINLKMKNISLDDEGIGTIRIRRQKSQTDYVTFISPEATIALKNYWEERNRDTETKIKGQDDYVFVSYGNRSKGGQLDPITVSRLFNIMGNQLGYENGDGFIKSRSHALRKYFSSTLENNGFPKNKVDYMLGHTVSDIDKAYFDSDPDKLKELYITYLQYLSFEKEIKVHSLNTDDAKRLDELAKENENLKKTVDGLLKDLANKGATEEVHEMREMVNAYQERMEVMESDMKAMKKYFDELLVKHPEQIAEMYERMKERDDKMPDRPPVPPIIASTKEENERAKNGYIKLRQEEAKKKH